MVFTKAALLKVGGFDPQFTSAGDDVDVCWRILDAGMRLGFCPAAFVWHFRRNTIKAYYGQQRGYGRAEAMLYCAVSRALQHPGPDQMARNDPRPAAHGPRRLAQEHSLGGEAARSRDGTRSGTHPDALPAADAGMDAGRDDARAGFAHAAHDHYSRAHDAGARPDLGALLRMARADREISHQLYRADAGRVPRLHRPRHPHHYEVQDLGQSAKKSRR